MNTVNLSPLKVMEAANKSPPSTKPTMANSFGGTLQNPPSLPKPALKKKARSVPPRPRTNLPPFLGRPETFLPPLLIVLTCFKVLLMPTYRSTDFDVHRNWLAITRNLPVEEWYFDNVNGTTVHTLDYPPAFAFFEWILANNPLTHQVLPPNDRCLDLLPDYDNEPSAACVGFQRSTVILSDIVLWMGAYMASRAIHATRPTHHTTLSFLLIVLNPGLLWLDHIHFQYNGMLLGVLLASLGLLMSANNIPSNTWSYNLQNLAGAALFALLLNLKHLFLPLAPVYFFYLLTNYCFEKRRFRIARFLSLAVVTAGTLVLPWVPFLLLPNRDDQIMQIASRLFPFDRGLVHDYWAANVWALYSFVNKVLGFASNRFDWVPISSLPEPTPLVCAGLLALAILPALFVVSGRRNNAKLLQAVVYTAMCSFMLAYHVHEKAIMTVLVPLALLVEQDHYGLTHNFLFWQTSLWGLLGLFPLLFRPIELVFKLVSFFVYIELSSYLMTTPPLWTRNQQQFSGALVGVVISILEFIPVHGKWEFVPLLVTSIICAQGLLGCWALSFWLLLRSGKVKVA